MLVPFSWLKEFVEVDVTPQELETKLFGCGFEVEELTEVGKDISGVVVGEVVECEAIPETHLHLCRVNVGQEEPLQICCGADNVEKGGKYPCALVGASVYATAKDHKTIEGVMTIKAGKLRGFDSFGMLCSGTELGLNDDLYPGAEVNGLLVLPADAVSGADVKPLLGMNDWLFDISVTANRPDCQSILGMAREVAAILNKPLKMPATDYTESEYRYDGLDIRVDAGDLCPRYIGHGVRNIRYGQSPQWMKRYLALSGLRSISNVVDITNFVMLEIGQPMHAFDMETLESKCIIVRRAAEGEGITTLDGKEFRLTPQNLVICDGEKPVALAGVMGGLNSEITEKTTQLLFESAKFARDNIRKTARGLGQNTDASSHYEKGISEYTTELGMARALHLIEELGCGEVTASHFDCSAGAPREGKHFTASLKRIADILGITVPTDVCLDILKRLEFDVTLKADGDTLEVTAPRYREDIEVGEPDLAEEIIREYGFDKIVPTFLTASTVTNGGESKAQKQTGKTKRVLCAQGFSEAMTMSFYGDEDLDALHIPADAPERQLVRLINPISANLNVMRPLLAPSLLKVVVGNLKKGNQEGRLFELANVYRPKELPVKELPEEIPHLGLAAFGAEEDFFSMKGALEALAEAFGLKFSFERAEDVAWLHPGIAAYVLADGERIGCFGKLSNQIMKELDLPKDSKENHKIFLAELDYRKLREKMPELVRYAPISEFPAVTRDLSLVVEEELSCGAITEEMLKACRQLSKAELFDIYRGQQVGEGKKSMSWRLSFLPGQEAPLTAEEVDKYIKKILGNLKFRLGIEIRE